VFPDGNGLPQQRLATHHAAGTESGKAHKDPASQPRRDKGSDANVQV